MSKVKTGLRSAEYWWPNINLTMVPYSPFKLCPLDCSFQWYPSAIPMVALRPISDVRCRGKHTLKADWLGVTTWTQKHASRETSCFPDRLTSYALTFSGICAGPTQNVLLQDSHFPQKHHSLPSFRVIKGKKKHRHTYKTALLLSL